MSNITDNLLEEERYKEKGIGSFMLPLFIALAVVMSALFIGEMLFGKNSLEVYLGLQKDDATLDKKIYLLQNQNANLQKRYFELKNIMPD